jgi:transketolase
VLIATGSEVSVALAAQQSLAAANVGARVVSMPSTTVFDRQDSRWQRAVLPREVPRIAVEAGHPDLWRKYVGLEGKVVGLARFGESAPASRLFEHFGLTAPAVVAAALEVTAPANASDRGQALAA